MAKTPKDPTEKSKPTKGQWARQFGRSTFSVAKSVLKDVMPFTSSVVNETSEALRDSKQFLKVNAPLSRQQRQSLGQTPVARSAKAIFEKAMDDLQSGEFAFKETADDLFSDFDNDISDDFSLDDDNADEGGVAKSPEELSLQGSRGVAKSVIRGSEAQLKALQTATEVIVRSSAKRQKANTAEILNTMLYSSNMINRTTAKSNRTLDLINSNISQLLAFQNENTSVANQAALDFYRTSTAMMNQMGEMVESIQTFQKGKGPSLSDGDMDLKNGFSRRDYMDFVKKNFSQTSLGSTLGLASMAKDLGLAKGFQNNPVGSTLKLLLGTLAPKRLGKIDQNVRRYAEEGLYRLGDQAYTGSNGIVRFLGSLLGKQRPYGGAHVSLSDYHKGAMGWNGEAQKVLVEAIPGYLARIESALTKEGPRYFDTERGLFRTTESIQNSVNDQNQMNVGFGFGRAIDKLQQTFENYQLAESDREKKRSEINQTIHSYLSGEGNISDYRKKMGSTMSFLSKQEMKDIILPLEDALEDAMKTQKELAANIGQGSSVYRNLYNVEGKGMHGKTFGPTDVFQMSFGSINPISFLEEVLAGTPYDVEAVKKDRKLMEMVSRGLTNDTPRETIRASIIRYMTTKNTTNKLKGAFNEAKSKIFGPPTGQTLGDRVSAPLNHLDTAAFERVFSDYFQRSQGGSPTEPAPLSPLVQPPAPTLEGVIPPQPSPESPVASMIRRPPKLQTKVGAASSNATHRSGLKSAGSAIEKEKNGIFSVPELGQQFVDRSNRIMSSLTSPTDMILNRTDEDREPTNRLIDQQINDLSEEPDAQSMGSAIVQSQKQNRTILQQISSVFQGMSGSLFGKKGLIRNIWDSDWRKEQLQKIKHWLFDEKDGIFGTQAKSLKEGWKDFRTNVGKSMVNGYDLAHRNTMTYLFGEDFKENAKYNKYLGWTDLKKHSETRAKKRAEEAALQKKADDLGLTLEQYKASLKPKEKQKSRPAMIAESLKPEEPEKTEPTETISVSEIPVMPSIGRVLGQKRNPKIKKTILKLTDAHKLQSINLQNITNAAFNAAKDTEARSEALNQSLYGDGKIDNKTKKSFLGKFKSVLPKAAAIGLVAGAATLLTGGHLGVLGSLFLPTNPIGAIIAGTGLTLLSHTEAFKSFMFGKMDEKSGERQGGIINQKLALKMKKSLPMLVGGATLGALKSVFMPSMAPGPLGLMLNVLLPGGPLGGAIMGMGIGMLKNSDTFKRLLFGKEKLDKDGNPTGDRMGTIITKSLAAIRKKTLPVFGKGLVGGGVGALAGVTLSHMGLIPAAFSLGGPIGMGLAGVGLGLASSTKRFNEYLFGTEQLDANGNPTGKRNKDGLLVRAKNIIQVDVIDPIAQAATDQLRSFGIWLKKKISIPFRLAFGPIMDSILGIKDTISDFIKDKFESLTKGIFHLFKSTLGVLFKPVKKILSGLGTATVKGLGLAGKITAAPVAAVAQLAQLATAGKRRKEYMSYYKQYYGNYGNLLHASWAGRKEQYKQEGKRGFFNTIARYGENVGDVLDIGLHRDNDVNRIMRGQYNDRMDEYGKNHLNWRAAPEEKRALRQEEKKNKKDSADWKKVDRLRRSIKDEFGGREVDLRDSQVNRYKKRFARYGIDTDALKTSDDIMNLVYHKGDWKKEHLTDTGRIRDGLRVVETPEQEAARTETSHYQTAVIKILNEMNLNGKALADHTVFKGDVDKQEEYERKRARRRLGSARHAGLGMDSMEENDLDMMDPTLFTTDEMNEYRESSFYEGGDYTGFLHNRYGRVKKSNARRSRPGEFCYRVRKPNAVPTMDESSEDALYPRYHVGRPNIIPGTPDQPTETTRTRYRVGRPSIIPNMKETPEEAPNSRLAAIQNAIETQVEILTGGDVNRTDMAEHGLRKWSKEKMSKFKQSNVMKGFFGLFKKDEDKQKKEKKEDQEQEHAEGLGIAHRLKNGAMKIAGFGGERSTKDSKQTSRLIKSAGMGILSSLGRGLKKTAKWYMVASLILGIANAFNPNFLGGMENGALGIATKIRDSKWLEETAAPAISGVFTSIGAGLAKNSIALIGIATTVLPTIAQATATVITQAGPTLISAGMQIGAGIFQAALKTLPSLVTSIGGAIYDSTIRAFFQHTATDANGNRVDITDAGRTSAVGHLARASVRSMGRGAWKAAAKTAAEEAANIPKAVTEVSMHQTGKHVTKKLVKAAAGEVTETAGKHAMRLVSRSTVEAAKSAAPRRIIASGMAGAFKTAGGKIARGTFKTLGAALGFITGGITPHMSGILTGLVGKKVGGAIATGVTNTVGAVSSIAYTQKTSIVKHLNDFIKILTEKASDSKVVKALSKIIGGSKSLKAIKSIFGVFINALKKVIAKLASTKAGALLSRISTMISKKLGKGAVGSIPIVTAIFGVYDGVTGAFEAANLFGVSDDAVDWKMRTVSSIMKMLLGFAILGAVIDVTLEIVSMVMNVDYKKSAATAIYGAISSKEDEEKLKASQQELEVERMIYNETNGTNLTLDEYNDKKNKGVMTRIWGSIKRGLGIDKRPKEDFKSYEAEAKALISVGDTSTSNITKHTTRQSNGKMYSSPSSPTGVRAGYGSPVGYGKGLSQSDPKWAKMRIGTLPNGKPSTMADGGCGPTALAMAANETMGRGPVTPQGVGKFAAQNGYISQGGANRGLFTEGASRMGLQPTQLGNAKQLAAGIATGKPVVVSGNGGGSTPFTKAGHIVVAKGMDSRGNVRIQDPMDGKNKVYPFQTVAKHATGGWVYNRKKAAGYGKPSYEKHVIPMGYGTIVTDAKVLNALRGKKITLKTETLSPPEYFKMLSAEEVIRFCELAYNNHHDEISTEDSRRKITAKKMMDALQKIAKGIIYTYTDPAVASFANARISRMTARYIKQPLSLPMKEDAQVLFDKFAGSFIEALPAGVDRKQYDDKRLRALVEQALNRESLQDYPKVNGLYQYDPSDPKWASLNYWGFNIGEAANGKYTNTIGELFSIASMLSTATGKPFTPEIIIKYLFPYMTAKYKEGKYGSNKPLWNMNTHGKEHFNLSNFFASGENVPLKDEIFKRMDGTELDGTRVQNLSSKTKQLDLLTKLASKKSYLVPTYSFKGSLFDNDPIHPEHISKVKPGSITGLEHLASPILTNFKTTGRALGYNDPMKNTPLYSKRANLFDAKVGPDGSVNQFRSNNAYSIKVGGSALPSEKDPDAVGVNANGVDYNDKDTSIFGQIGSMLKKIYHVAMEGISSKLMGRQYKQQLDKDGNYIGDEDTSSTEGQTAVGGGALGYGPDPIYKLNFNADQAKPLKPVTKTAPTTGGGAITLPTKKSGLSGSSKSMINLAIKNMVDVATGLHNPTSDTTGGSTANQSTSLDNTAGTFEKMGLYMQALITSKLTGDSYSDVRDALLSATTLGASSGMGSFDIAQNPFPTNAKNYQENYVRGILGSVMNASKKYHLFPSTLLGMSALESDYGRSDVARNADNLWGWRGTYKGGPTYKGYGVFPDVETSVDYVASKLGQGGSSRYKNVSQQTNYLDQIRIIQQSGYNPYPDYVGKVNSTIGTNGYTYFDDPKHKQDIQSKFGINYGNPMGFGDLSDDAFTKGITKDIPDFDSSMPSLGLGPDDTADPYAPNDPSAFAQLQRGLGEVGLIGAGLTNSVNFGQDPKAYEKGKALALRRLSGTSTTGSGSGLTIHSSYTDNGASSGPVQFLLNCYGGKYHVTSPFGPRTNVPKGASKFHRGTDIGMPVGTPIYSVSYGSVVKTDTGGSGPRGKYVEIQDGGGYYHIYQHLSKTAVKVGDYIEKGALIAFSGNTGIGSGPHLHYEVQTSGKTAIHPSQYPWSNSNLHGIGFGDPLGFGSDDALSTDPSIGIDPYETGPDLSIRTVTTPSQRKGSSRTIMGPMQTTIAEALDSSPKGYGDHYAVGSNPIAQKLDIALNSKSLEGKMDALIDVVKDWYIYSKTSDQDQKSTHSSTTNNMVASTVVNGGKKQIIMQKSSDNATAQKMSSLRALHKQMAQ